MRRFRRSGPVTVMSEKQLKFGPILLAPGIKRSDAFGYLFITMVLGCLQAFMAIIQPYVFTEQMHIPASQQGHLVGNLAATQQAALLVFVAIFGSLSDRFGRRLFLMLALVGMVAGMLLYPLATIVIHLFVIRFLFGIGSTAYTAGAPAMRFDITDNNSRGRILSLSQILHLVGNFLLVSWLGTRLPAYLAHNRGLSNLQAGRYTFYAIALIGAISLIVGFIYLRRDRPVRAERVSVVAIAKGMATSLRAVLAHAKIDPRFRLVLMASVVLRAEVTVLTSFLALWIINAGRAQGLTSPEALKNYGTVAMIVTTAELVFSFIAGFVADRVNRLKMLIASIICVAIAFSMVLLVHDVTGWLVIAVVLVINCAEAAQSASSQALIGEVTPAHLRGSSYGIIAWIGTVSVIAITLICGYLVDLTQLGYRAPFLFMSALSVLFLLFAFIFLRTKSSAPALGVIDASAPSRSNV
jgi:MFS family permease